MITLILHFFSVYSSSSFHPFSSHRPMFPDILPLCVFNHDPAPMITQKSRGCSLALTSSTSQTLATGSTQINPQISSAPSSPSFSPSCFLPYAVELFMLVASERLLTQNESQNSAASARWSGVINDTNRSQHWTKLILLQQPVPTFK